MEISSSSAISGPVPRSYTPETNPMPEAEQRTIGLASGQQSNDRPAGDQETANVGNRIDVTA